VYFGILVFSYNFAQSNKMNMTQLKKGSNVKLQCGGSITVSDELGEGGQGYVYKVKHDSGKNML